MFDNNDVVAIISVIKDHDNSHITQSSISLNLKCKLLITSDLISVTSKHVTNHGKYLLHNVTLFHCHLGIKLLVDVDAVVVV
ncbi:hypothetical protein DPMN_133746 [Dreissena polymorpha]|uniref:Uncharacterized protein n=1 Tax=Dreissena polymorpha TaxID=45954 RepID=A0A9D4JE98_DREPO|nr:hypothetical protein DPMN_133746 [Dreissena polymorpha]